METTTMNQTNKFVDLSFETENAALAFAEKEGLACTADNGYGTWRLVEYRKDGSVWILGTRAGEIRAQHCPEW